MTEAPRPERLPTSEEISVIVNTFIPRTEEVIFFYDSGRITVGSRVPSILSEEELLAYAIKQFDLNPETLDGYSREEVVSEMRRKIERRGLGGLGITDRTLKDIYRDLQGAEPYLNNAQGKVVFIGNGFSIAPLELSENDKEGRISDIIVSDIFDYQTVLQDVIRLKQAFANKKLKTPETIDNLGTTLETLVSAIQTRRIKFVKHIFGRDSLPEELKGARLVVNSYGPPAVTVSEQLDMLAPEGVLVTYLKPDQISIPVTFSLMAVLGKPTEKRAGSVIQRRTA